MAASTKAFSFFVPFFLSMMLLNRHLFVQGFQVAKTVTARSSVSRHGAAASRLMASSSTDAVQRLGTDDPRMSKVVVHSGVVYMSGITDTTADDVEGQTKNVLNTIDHWLEEAGTSKSNLLTASIWLKDIGQDFQAMNGVWCDWLDPENKPVRATVESPMARPEILVEIQVTATTGK